MLLEGHVIDVPDVQLIPGEQLHPLLYLPRVLFVQQGGYLLLLARHAGETLVQNVHLALAPLNTALLTIQGHESLLLHTGLVRHQ